MTDLVAADIDKNRDDVTSIAIVPDAPPEGVHLGAGWHIRARIALKDGSTYDKLICGGVVHEAACKDATRLEIRSALDAYLDMPEGSTPLPSLASVAVEGATPIVVPTLSIPIDHEGSYEVVLGEGSLPHGAWMSATAEFADPWPSDLALREAIVRIELRSLEPGGKPFDNAYAHGWRPGVERVRAVLVFDVLWFRPGARLEITNVRVD